MRPKSKSKKKKKKKEKAVESDDTKLDDIEMKKQLFPGLAIANNPDVRVLYCIS